MIEKTKMVYLFLDTPFKPFQIWLRFNSLNNLLAHFNRKAGSKNSQMPWFRHSLMNDMIYHSFLSRGAMGIPTYMEI